MHVGRWTRYWSIEVNQLQGIFQYRIAARRAPLIVQNALQRALLINNQATPYVYSQEKDALVFQEHDVDLVGQ